MKLLLIGVLMIGVSSCGKSSKSGSKNSSQTSEITTNSSEEVKDLAKTLLKAKSLPQKEVLIKLLALRTMNESVLLDLDKEIEIDCINGICEFKEKI